MKSPAFQLYVQDFLLGTMGMDDAEVGAYIRMLCQQWDKGFLPKNEQEISKLSGSKRKNVIAVLPKFKEGADGKLRNERLEKERDKQLRFKESRRENANRRWKQEQSTSNARASAVHVQDECKDDAFQSSSSISSSESDNARADAQGDSPGETPKPEVPKPPKPPASDQLPANYRRPASAPALAEVIECFHRLGKPDEAQGFFDYYEGLNWHKGITPIINWASFANRWVAGEKPQNQSNATGSTSTAQTTDYATRRALAEQREANRAAARDRPR